MNDPSEKPTRSGNGPTVNKGPDCAQALDMNAKRIANPHIRSQRPVKWLFAGDSITQGAVQTDGWRDYTQLFKERLGELGRNEDVVINTAVGGWSLEQFASRRDDRVFSYQPHVVLMMFGTNDAVGGNSTSSVFSSDMKGFLEFWASTGLI